MQKKDLYDVDFKNKIVLVRVDFNVPIKNKVIMDNNRIVAAILTIKYLIKQKAKIVLFSHLGKIKTIADLDKNNLAPVATELSKLLNDYNVRFINAIEGSEVETAINKMKNGDIILLQNTRYADLKAKDGSVQVDSEGKAFLKRESKNDPELGKYWASLGDVFVNDAFGTAHRSHASNVGIASNIQTSCLGFLVEKEIKMLSQGIDNPNRPFVAIIGGAKVSDKISVIKNLLKKADKILIGGGMAYTFFAAQGYKVGKSLLEEDKISEAKEFLDNAKGKIILPLDSLIAPEFDNLEPQITENIDIPDNFMGLDIGPKTIKLFTDELIGAKTVVWNGPMGVFEFSNFSGGTLAICKAIANLKGAFTLIGGGDSAAAAIQLGFKNNFTHISTGGGASLEYMEGKTLPGIAVIQNK